MADIPNKEIEKAIINGIQDNAQRIFERSQDTIGCFVPVLSGNLKSTGFKEDTQNGSTIGYTADYSRDVEFGHEEKPITEITRVYVPSYRKKNGTVVPGHYKNVQGRVIKFEPKISKFERGEEITRVLTSEKKTDGQQFLTRATYQELDNFIDDLAKNLAKVKLGGKVRVTFIKH